MASITDILVDNANVNKAELRAYLAARETVSAKDPSFGVAGDGQADDTAGLRKAIGAVLAPLASSSGGGVYSGSAPTLFLPRGRYRVTGDLGAGRPLNYLNIQGENAIIEAAPGVTVLPGLRYNVRISGLTVRGGATAISVGTGNIDSTMITVSGCEFHQQSETAIQVDPKSNSTQLLVTGCKFINGQPNARILTALSGDHIKFSECWVTTHARSTAAFDVTDAYLILEDIVGVPNGLTAWVKLSGVARLWAHRVRFGGEGGGTSDAIVVNHAAADTTYPVIPTSIVMRDCLTYSKGPLLHLHAIPNVVDVSGCTGLVDTPPVRVASGVRVEDLRAIGALGSIFRLEFNSNDYGPYVDPASSPAAAREALPRVHDRAVFSARPNVTDLAVQSAGSVREYGASAEASGVTAADATDELGVPAKQFSVTSSAGPNQARLQYAAALRGLPEGLYTAVFDLEVMSPHTVQPVFTAAYTRSRQFTLARGKHTVCIPFYHHGDNAQAIGVALYNMGPGTTLQWQRWRVYYGRRHVSQKRVELEGSGPPPGRQFFKGDFIWNTNPAAGGAMGWVCVASGSPGTWRPWGAIS